MAKTTFNGTTYKTKKRMRIEESKKILKNYHEPITLRQLYYRLVAKGYLNNRSQYMGLSKALVDARLNGEIPFDALEDRQRKAVGEDEGDDDPEEYFNLLQEIYEGAGERFRVSWKDFSRPRWDRQPYYVEAWVEKQALSKIFEKVCKPLGVTSYAGKGYSSLTAEKEAVDRFKSNGKENVILYFGDFDPSGNDIERDFTDKLQGSFGVSIQVKRIALTKSQIDEMQLPPQPAKKSDTRYEDFVEEHEDMAVELDAIDPDQLESMIEDAIDGYFDEEIHEKVKKEEREQQKKIKNKINNYFKDQEKRGE